MAEEQNRFNPTFENGGFWEYYRDLERQYQSYLEYVPYLEGNENTYSFRLANIILAVGAHIDSALKKIAENPSLSSKYPEMTDPKVRHGQHKGDSRDQELIDYFPISEEYKLYEKTVSFKRLPDRETISPFRDYKKELGKVPYWWTAYNRIKHNLSANLRQADLKTTRDALAGAFLLNVIYEPASNRLFQHRLLQPKYQQGISIWEVYNDSFNGLPMFSKRLNGINCKNPFTIESPLFLYDYEEPFNK